MPKLLAVAAVAAYLSSAWLIWRDLQGAAQRKAALWVWSVALLLHGVLLANDLFQPSGLDLCLFNSLSMVAWLVSLLLWLACLRMPLHSLGLPLLPMVAVLITIIGALHPTLGRHIVIGPLGLQLHVAGSLLAYAMLSLATLQAMVLAYQDHQLRNHRITGWMRHLPPLQHMEHFLFQLIGAGFVLLSVALVTGFVFLENIFAQHLVHKTVLSIVAWVVFGLLLLGRWRLGWRGRVAIRWTLVGFALLMLAYFGSKFVLEVLLVRGA